MPRKKADVVIDAPRKLTTQEMIDSMTLEKVPVSSLIPWDQNPRVHGELEALCNSIGHFGWTNPILVQRSTRRIIAGTRRYLSAVKNGLEIVPAIFLDYDDQQAAAYTIADNAMAEQSTWDFSKLEEILSDLKIDGFDMDLTGLSDNMLDRLMPSEEDGAGKEYDVDIANGVQLEVILKVRIPAVDAGNIEEDIRELIERYPTAKVERVA